MFVVRTSEKAPASSVIISTVSEVFLQNYASLSRLPMTRKSKNAMNWLFLKLNFLQNHGSMNLQDHRLNDSAVFLPIGFGDFQNLCFLFSLQNLCFLFSLNKWCIFKYFLRPSHMVLLLWRWGLAQKPAFLSQGALLTERVSGVTHERPKIQHGPIDGQAALTAH